MLIWTNINVISTSFPQNNIKSNQENTDIPTHIDHNHIDYIDILVPISTKINTTKLIYSLELISVIKICFSNNYNSNIWQPPKFV